MDAAMVDGNGTQTGRIIMTTIGGRQGQPKQVDVLEIQRNQIIRLNFKLIKVDFTNTI